MSHATRDHAPAQRLDRLASGIEMLGLATGDHDVRTEARRTRVRSARPSPVPAPVMKTPTPSKVPAGSTVSPIGGGSCRPMLSVTGSSPWSRRLAHRVCNERTKCRSGVPVGSVGEEDGQWHRRSGRDVERIEPTRPTRPSPSFTGHPTRAGASCRRRAPPPRPGAHLRPARVHGRSLGAQPPPRSLGDHAADLLALVGRPADNRRGPQLRIMRGHARRHPTAGRRSSLWTLGAAPAVGGLVAGTVTPVGRRHPATPTRTRSGNGWCAPCSAMRPGTSSDRSASNVAGSKAGRSSRTRGAAHPSVRPRGHPRAGGGGVRLRHVALGGRDDQPSRHDPGRRAHRSPGLPSFRARDPPGGVRPPSPNGRWSWLPRARADSGGVGRCDVRRDHGVRQRRHPGRKQADDSGNGGHPADGRGVFGSGKYRPMSTRPLRR